MSSTANGAPLSAFAARKARFKPIVKPRVATETFRGASEAKDSSPVHPTEPTDPKIQRKSRKRKRVVPDIAAENSTEVPSAPSLQDSLSQEVLESSDLKVPVELAGSDSTSRDRKLGTNTPISVDEAGFRETSSDPEIDYESDQSSEGEIQLRISRKIEQRLSTFVPYENNVLSSSREEWTISLTDGDTLVLVGQYELWIRKGAVTILGAVLHPSSKLYRVYAPSTHALPAIRHIRSPFGPPQQPAVITIKSCRTGLRLLRGISRKFARIWNRENANHLEDFTSRVTSGRSFSYLENTAQDLYQRTLAPLRIPLDWQSLFVELLDSSNTRAQAIMVCGPKGSGKSTLVRLLTNDFLSKSSSSSGVALLDLDPGQPEYSPPGDVSLVHLKSYNLGPPYIHPLIPEGSENNVIRAHHIGANSPRDDPYHYVQCAVELHTRYQHMLSGHPLCPLIINCCGWIQGTGLEILEQFVLTMRPTDVIYMSKTGPEEVMDVLQLAVDRIGSSLHTLSSQPSDVALRTAADLRTMQTLSYFHTDHSENSLLCWDPSPIHTKRPLVFQYAGPYQTILGIMILGAEIPFELLGDLVNGSVLGVVAVEHDSSLPEDVLKACNEFDQRPPNSRGRNIDTMGLEADGVSSPDQYNRDELSNQGFEELEDVNGEQLSDAPEPHTPKNPVKPTIRRTKDGLPYFFTGFGTCVPLDPSRSHCIGQVLIRAIDKQSQQLQVITPIPPATLRRYRELGIKLMLVRGKLDIPAWAYEEECVAGTAAQKERSRWRRHREAGEVEDSEDGMSDLDDFDVEAWAQRTPWMSVVKKTKDRKDRVWKVRRNLKTRVYEGRSD